MLLPLNAWSNTASAILKWMLLIAYLAIALYLGELKEWLSGARAGGGERLLIFPLIALRSEVFWQK